MIRMINGTKNGYADAYSEIEAKEYEAKGWARFVKSVPVDMNATFERIDAPKRGRPAKLSVFDVPAARVGRPVNEVSFYSKAA